VDHLRLHHTAIALIRVRALAVVAIAWIALTPSHSQAQVTGKVVAESGQPISGVAVELWAGPQRIANKSTGADGTFTLGAANDTVRGSRTLTARKIGFRPASLLVERGPAPLTISLVPLPPMLDEVAVTTGPAAPRDPCTRKPSPEAAAIFARAAAYYRDDTRWLDRIARYVHVARSTKLADRQTMFGVEQRGGWTRNGGLYDGPTAGTTTAVPRRLSASERLALAFPVPERKSEARGTTVGWELPRFHEWESPSFVSRAFVDSMPMSVVSKSRQGIVLGFCPRVRTIPYTSGEIELGTDSTIIAIRWHFIIEKPGQDAGGIAIFAAPESKSVKAHLLPANAVSWTRLPNSERFESTEYSYGRWLVAEPGETVRAVPP
jgi:hypothetical protein